jgi:hypothetical protein
MVVMPTVVSIQHPSELIVEAATRWSAREVSPLRMPSVTLSIVSADCRDVATTFVTSGASRGGTGGEASTACAITRRSAASARSTSHDSDSPSIRRSARSASPT